MPGARIVVPASVIRELDRLGERSTPDHRAARELAARFASTPVAAEGDRAIVQVALELQATVVTADRALQRELVAVRRPVLVPRDRHRLELRPPDPAAAERRSARRGPPNR